MSDLYHPLILKHSREPHQFQKRENAGLILDAYNPICGDDFHFYLDIVNDHLEKLSFHGYGCAVSKASASLLVQRLDGLTRIAAEKKVDGFLAMVEAGGEQTDLDLAVFAIARKYPGRVTCATLAWKTMKAYLRGNA